jgi:replicative DNA helicase
MKKSPSVFDAYTDGLPHDPNWEKLVLSIAIQHPAKLAELAPIVSTDDFSTDQNRLIWSAIAQLHGENIFPGAHSLSERLLRSGQLEAAGGFGSIADLTDPAPNLPDVARCVAILREYSVRRRAILQANELMLLASARDCDAAELLRSGERAFAKLASDLKSERAFVTLTESLAAQGGMNVYLANEGSEDAIQTHLPKLNRMIPAGGFRPGELVILAALTSRGKTAWALNLALHVARHNKRIAFVSMEMDEASIYDRLISAAAEMDLYALRRCARNAEAERERRESIRNAAHFVASLPVSVSHAPGTTPAKVQSELRRIEPPDLVIVDYLQLMSGGGKFGTREQEVTTISRALKRMAADLEVPVLALSQFSRESARADRKPQLHDLRESGAIEQDANTVLFIHFTRMWDTGAGIPNGDAELIIAKQRNGALGSVNMNFHAPTGVFTEAA